MTSNPYLLLQVSKRLYSIVATCKHNGYRAVCLRPIKYLCNEFTGQILEFDEKSKFSYDMASMIYFLLKNGVSPYDVNCAVSSNTVESLVASHQVSKPN